MQLRLYILYLLRNYLLVVTFDRVRRYDPPINVVKCMMPITVVKCMMPVTVVKCMMPVTVVKCMIQFTSMPSRLKHPH